MILLILLLLAITKFVFYVSKLLKIHNSFLAVDL